MEGVKGIEGVKSKLIYNKGSMILEETILVFKYPSEKKGLCEHKHMSNTKHTRFTDIGNGETLNTSELDYLKFKSFSPKLMALLFPGMFRKISEKWMKQFKDFAEAS
mgnify:CR=1 FL=1